MGIEKERKEKEQCFKKHKLEKWKEEKAFKLQMEDFKRQRENEEKKKKEEIQAQRRRKLKMDVLQYKAKKKQEQMEAETAKREVEMRRREMKLKKKYLNDDIRKTIAGENGNEDDSYT